MGSEVSRRCKVVSDGSKLPQGGSRRFQESSTTVPGPRKEGLKRGPRGAELHMESCPFSFQDFVLPTNAGWIVICRIRAVLQKALALHMLAQSNHDLNHIQTITDFPKSWRGSAVRGHAKCKECPRQPSLLSICRLHMQSTLFFLASLSARAPRARRSQEKPGEA